MQAPSERRLVREFLEIEADHCICTLPFPILRRIEITPPFFARKMEAIRNYDLVDVVRVSMQTKSRLWRNDPAGTLGGLNMVGTDTRAGRIWNTSALQPDPRMGMQHAYMFDRQAGELGAVPMHERVDHCVRMVSEFLPQLQSEVAASYVKVWSEDPWQLEAIAWQRQWDIVTSPTRVGIRDQDDVSVAAHDATRTTPWAASKTSSWRARALGTHRFL